MKVSELVSQNVGNAITNFQTWGGILYNVKAFGAAGNGTTDDSAAVARAIAAIVSAGKGILYFPAGTFKFNSSITVSNISVKIQGSGIGITKLLFASGVSGIVYSTINVWDIFEVRDLKMLADGLGGADGITATWPSVSSDTSYGALFENLYLGGSDGYVNDQSAFTKYWRIGLKVTDGWQTMVNNFHIIGSSTVGQMTNGININKRSIETHLFNVTVFGANIAIQVNGQCEGFQMDKGQLVNCLEGIFMNGDVDSVTPPGTSIINTHISSFNSWIRIKGWAQLHISNGLYYRATGALENPNFIGINLQATAASSNNSIDMHDNTMLNLGTVGAEFAVRIYNSNQCIVKNNFISSFYIGVGVETTSVETHVIKNYFKSCTFEYLDQGTNSYVEYEKSSKVRAYHNTSQSIANGAQTTLVFNSERYDSEAMHDTATNTNRLTCKTTGLYIITAQVSWAANAVGRRFLTIYLNGTTEIAEVANAPSSDGTCSQNVTTHYQLNVNDYVEVRVFQDSGGANVINSNVNYSPEFMMVRVG